MGKVRKLWTQEQLEMAITAIRNGESIGLVSRRSGVPKSTLWSKLTGRVPMNKSVGPGTVLTADEEKVIVQWILHWNSRGFPVTKSQLINNVENFVKNLKRATPFVNNRPGRHWYEGFLNRHPNVSCRIAKNSNASRYVVNEENLKTWFQKIKEHLDEIEIHSMDGSRIFNLDELAFFVCPESEDAYLRKRANGFKNFVQNEEKEYLSVVFSSNAIGMFAPPMALFKYKRVPYSLLQNVPSDWIAGKSTNGWLTSEALFDYITSVFHPWLIENNFERPIVLYVDGHSSQVTYTLAKFCSDNQIELLSLFPKSLHILQPLDVALLNPLTEEWRKCISHFQIEKQSKIRKEDFCNLLKLAMDSLKLPDIMNSGFQKTGLYPFSLHVLNYKELFSNNPNPHNTITEEAQEIAKRALKYSELFIDSRILQEFKLAEKYGVWTGDPRHESLFAFWLTTVKRSRGTSASFTSEEAELSNNSHDDSSELENFDPEDEDSEETIVPKVEVVLQVGETNFDVIFNDLLPDDSEDTESVINISNESSQETLRTNENMESLAQVNHNECQESIQNSETGNGTEKRRRKRKDVTKIVYAPVEIQSFDYTEEIQERKRQRQEEAEKKKKEQEEIK